VIRRLVISAISAYLSAQTAFYSLNPNRDIPGPLAINPAYIRLAQASASYRPIISQLRA
jgi:hypothetical protein